MIAQLTAGAGELAHIYLKNGEQRTGILLNDINNPESFEGGLRLISHQHIASFLEHRDETLVETFDPEQLDGVDVYLK
jgi:hypothetical protein